jgi:phage repressor protein C with HTH and peptisase S24 domain
MERELLEKPGTALLPREIPYAAGMFVSRGWGGSMMPTIRDGSWLFFHPNVVGTRQDRLVLVEDGSEISGHRYTLKKYHATKIYTPDGTWTHGDIRLVSLNPSYPEIILKKDGNYHIIGSLVGCARKLERVEPIQYSDPTE